MTIKSNNPGIYQTLVSQLDKVARHIRQGSFRTKERYYEAMKRFCRFLADHYHLQKLANISGKHLTAYIIDMQERGKSASTIKTDLAAIRFYHDMMGQAKYRLLGNDELAVELERRRFGQKDRTWSIREFNLFHDSPRPPAQLRRPDLSGIGQRRYEPLQRQLAGIPAFGA